MREVIFWGGTGQAKVLYEAIGRDIILVAIVDNRELENSPVSGVPLLHGEIGLEAWLGKREPLTLPDFAVAIGGGRGKDRLDIMSVLQKRGLAPVSIVHKTAFIAKSCSFGKGCQILAMAAVCANAQLGKGVIINTSASVDHDCVIGDGVHIAPGVKLAGEVVVEEGAFIGTGAVVLPRIRIGKNAIVGAGAVVTKDVKSSTTVAGNPAFVFPS